MSTFKIPEFSLVVLVGASGSGKSSFARKHFLATEVLSSDYFRGLVADDENCQDATRDAFDVLYYILDKRLAAGRLSVVDATNVRAEDRKRLLEVARRHDLMPVAVVLNLPEAVCHERNKDRPDRQFGTHVVRNQTRALRSTLRGLEREGFRYVHEMRSVEDVENASFERVRMWTDLRHESGPFDLIGDVHGCFEELSELLAGLGYVITRTTPAAEDEEALPDERDVDRTGVAAWARGFVPEFSVTHPEGRKAVFVGDLVDRGPDSPSVLKLVMAMVASGTGLCVPGNHDVKLQRKLSGRNVQISHGLAETLEQLALEPESFSKRVKWFIDSMVSHFVLDGGKLVVAHAGMKEAFQGRASGRVRDFALYGETTGETDEFGLPVRYPWAADYRGKARVVYGHTPVPEADWLNGTINIDTGCVFGGKLTALRYPEMEVVSVASKRTYAEPSRPFLTAASPLSAQQENDDVLVLDDVMGKRLVETRLRGKVMIREENATAALEVISRFATDPKWLVYLPPTMSPTETTSHEGLLEHPREGFSYFAAQGVGEVVCEEKHMGSRAVVIVCREPEVAVARFGVAEPSLGVVFTRTGRRFFEDVSLEQRLLARVRDAMTATGFWEQFATDWVVLDCELMPWSAKAQDLLKRQYAPVGAAASAGLAATSVALERMAAREVPGTEEVVARLFAETERRRDAATRFIESYRNYCWKVSSLEDLRLAPFHILATEGAVHVDKNHVRHMEAIAAICEAEPGVLFRTPFMIVDTADEASVSRGIEWWEALTTKGGEGMVIKPMDFVARSEKGLVQPAVKCRGPEYLRIIYGPHYLEPENLSRLRKRGISTKRSLALREFGLGIEALERFVRREPLRRVHECVFGVLAMESEPVDPRL